MSLRNKKDANAIAHITDTCTQQQNNYRRLPNAFTASARRLGVDYIQRTKAKRRLTKRGLYVSDAQTHVRTTLQINEPKQIDG